ncbi:ATP-binding protein [Solwaraspora sp. WMMD406]|uniref:ATP-binding protein n=1 Tax=Solwaraspora sp. WMMD406 TaxID=3016095 RepID=UPI002417B583|nr:ATP-binding protein [Solwaraspora sp. WMMD406]MDG4766349.1 ATP-binding protein [Solwaraspora sp. WMMD406]
MSSPDPTAVDTDGRTDLVRTEPDLLDQPFDQDGLYGLRATLSAHAPRLRVSQEETEHLLIVASELATNAIRHGGGTGRLRLWRHGDSLYCEVSDHGPGITDQQVGTVPPNQSRTGGRGVWICRQLCSDLTIAHGPSGQGAVVTAVLSVGAPAARP